MRQTSNQDARVISMVLFNVIPPNEQHLQDTIHLLLPSFVTCTAVALLHQASHAQQSTLFSWFSRDPTLHIMHKTEENETAVIYSSQMYTHEYVTLFGQVKQREWLLHDIIPPMLEKIKVQLEVNIRWLMILCYLSVNVICQKSQNILTSQSNYVYLQLWL